MIQFSCHSCGTPLQVAEAHIGAMVACPKCKTTLQVPAPAVVAPQPVVPVVAAPRAAPSSVPLPPLPPTPAPYYAASMPAPVAPAPAPYPYPAAAMPAPVAPAPVVAAPSRSGAGAGLFSLWRILVLAGCGLMFLAFLLPWWSIKIDTSDYGKASESDRKAYEQALKDNKDWYTDHLGKKDKSKVEEFMKSRDATKLSVTLWGWDTGAGIAGLIFFFLIVAIVLLPVFLPVLRPWAWTGFMAASVFGLILLILSMVWLFGPPGDSAGSLLSQGISIGPFIGLLAALLILTGAIKESISGLLSFLKQKGARQPALA